MEAIVICEQEPHTREDIISEALVKYSIEFLLQLAELADSVGQAQLCGIFPVHHPLERVSERRIPIQWEFPVHHPLECQNEGSLLSAAVPEYTPDHS
ncbi:hypothetical protein BDN72DRAFT_835529, partial [Pluteus cervinus]